MTLLEFVDKNSIGLAVLFVIVFIGGWMTLNEILEYWFKKK